MGRVDYRSLEKLISDKQFEQSEKEIQQIADPTVADYYRSMLSYKQGKYNEALEFLDRIEDPMDHSSFDFAEKVLRLQVNALHFKGDYQASHDLIEKIRQHEEYRKNAFMLLAVDMGNYLFMGEFDMVIELGKEGLKLDEVKQNKSERMKILKNIGTAYFQLGKYTEAEEYFQRSLEHNRILEDTTEFAILHNNIGLVKYAQGDLDEALHNYSKAVQAFESTGAQNNAAVVYSNIGLIYQSKNQVNKALEHMKRSLKIQEQLGNNYYISICLTNLARIYNDKGSYELADQYLTRSIALNEELENDYLLAESYTEYGQLMHRKGNFEISREFMSKALELRKKVGDKNMTSYTLYIMIKMEADTDFDKARSLHQELEEIAHEFENKYVHIRYQLSKALMLRHSSRLKHHFQAQVIYERLLDEDLPHYDFKIDVILNLFELLIQEITYTKETDLLTELERLSGALLALSEEQKSNVLLANYYVLQSKIEFLKANIEESKHLMMLAMQTAEEHDLLLQARQISDQFDQLIEDIQQMKPSSDGTTSFSQNVDLLEFESFINMLGDKTEIEVSQNQEDPCVFFMIKNGSVVYDFNFDQTCTFSPEVDLIGRYTSLYESFVQNGQAFELFKSGSNSVILSFINQIMIGYVFVGPSYGAIQKFNTILTIIRSSHHLQEFLSGQLAFFSDELRAELLEIISHTYEIERSPEVLSSGIEISHIVRPLPILKNYELLLHPIRLIIVKVLVAHYSLLRSDLLDLTGLNSGTLQTHLDTLEKNEWISKEIEFVDNRPRSILYIETKGSQFYREFMDIFKEHILGI